MVLNALAACGGGGSGSSSSGSTPTPVSMARLPVTISDASSEDWATIGVKILSLSLTKSDGTTTSVTLPSTTTSLNLVQLDQLSSILGSLSLTPGDTYTAATLTISGNPGDVTLISSADPSGDFAGTPSTQIPAAQIQIQNTQGTAPNLTVTIPVKFDTPFVVPAATSSVPIDLEVDLGHPAFILAQVPATAGAPIIWAVNFNNGPIKKRHVDKVANLYLRHLYGTVVSVATDNTSLSLTEDLPTVPVPTSGPETFTATTQSDTILADAANGTIVDDLVAKTSSVVKDFSTLSALLKAGEFVRVASRYQANGTLVATHIWASANFSDVWLSPEGHVLHVNANNNSFVVSDENGKPVRMNVDANTQFTWHSAPIGTGTSFLANNVLRGFKVHTTAVDNTIAQPWVAKSVDIETAALDGKITTAAANTTGFTISKQFNSGWGDWQSIDDYSVPVNLISSITPNGTDISGTAITGFKFWYFSYPTLIDSGAIATSDFFKAVGGSINFGGRAGQVYAHGLVHANWGDPLGTGAPATGWYAPWVIIEPAPIPMATVTGAYSSTSNNFVVTAYGGTNPVTVDVATTSGSATLVYQLSRNNDRVQLTPLDITTSAGQTALASALVSGTKVKISAVPQPDGTLKAYAIAFFTGSDEEK